MEAPLRDALAAQAYRPAAPLAGALAAALWPTPPATLLEGFRGVLAALTTRRRLPGSSATARVAAALVRDVVGQWGDRECVGQLRRALAGMRVAARDGGADAVVDHVFVRALHALDEEARKVSTAGGGVAPGAAGAGTTASACAAAAAELAALARGGTAGDAALPTGAGSGAEAEGDALPVARVRDGVVDAINEVLDELDSATATIREAVRCTGRTPPAGCHPPHTAHASRRRTRPTPRRQRML